MAGPERDVADPAGPAAGAAPEYFAPSMRTSEDWWAIWLGGLILAVCFLAVWFDRPSDLAERAASGEAIQLTSPLKPFVSKPAAWSAAPWDAFYVPASEERPADLEESAAGGDAAGARSSEAGTVREPVTAWRGVLGMLVGIGLLFSLAMACRGKPAVAFLVAFPFVFALATLAYVLAGHEVVKSFNLEYALWALFVGLIISNTVGTPGWLRPAVLTEFYIKTGLVLLGAEVLMSRLLALGVPGVFVAWVVTPIVLISTYWFGQKVLKIESKSLNMVISADMSVCGVSAAIATAASCRAKKEELSLAIGLSLTFTVIMMVVLPKLIQWIGMDPLVGGAWVGGTIDSTGAVGVAGAELGERAEKVAITVKLIQNVLIGVTAFGVAVYWVTSVGREVDGARPRAIEIWYRFPKFVLGFVAASILFTILHGQLTAGPELVDATIKGTTKTFRGYLFCLAFVSIGLETDFRALLPQLRGGKPLVLYILGQSLNLCLTLLMAWLMFGVVFRDLIEQFAP